MQEEAQQRHEQRLARLLHGASRIQAAPRIDSLAALASEFSEPGKVSVKMGKRPDTAFEGGDLPADVGCKAIHSSTNSPAISDSSARATSQEMVLDTLQDLGEVTTQSDGSSQADKLCCTAHLRSHGLDRLPARPLPPQKAGARIKPSPRPRQACRKAPS